MRTALDKARNFNKGYNSYPEGKIAPTLQYPHTLCGRFVWIHKMLIFVRDDGSTMKMENQLHNPYGSILLYEMIRRAYLNIPHFWDGGM